MIAPKLQAIHGGRGEPVRIEADARPLREITADALGALNISTALALADGDVESAVFVRGGALTRVRRDEHDRPMAEQLGEPQVRGILARVANFERIRKAKATDVPPPREVVQDVLARPSWTLPPLEGITESPTLRTDGTVLDQPGYDSKSRLAYMPTGELKVPAVPEQPGPKQRERAIALLAELFADFPFVDEASRANALALALTPIVRPAIAGQVPLALVDGTKAGTGKGLLVGSVAVIATGRPAAVLTAPAREEEWAKTVFAAVLRGATILLLDEVSELRSPALAAALTAPVLEGRLLGRSEMAQLPQRATWAAAGNNVSLGGDLARRCYPIRLDAKVSRPWRRSGFRHADLLGWASERRADLLWSALVLSTAWYDAGKPTASTPVLGGFSEWASTLGGILAHAGITGFLGNLETFYDQADHEAASWEAFLSAWRDTFNDRPVRVGDLAASLPHTPALRDALPDDLAQALDRGAGSFKAKLGRALGKRVGTRYGDRGLRVERGAQDARSTAYDWLVLTDEPAQGSQGLQGSERHATRTPRHASARKSDEHTPATPAPLQEPNP